MGLTAARLTPGRVAVAAVLLGALPRPTAGADTTVAPTAAVRFDHLDRQIRDGTVPRAQARRDLARLLLAVRAQRRDSACRAAPRAEWVFPLAGYGPSAIGGRRGSGYQPRGYDYFDGNRHRGHPAHDLFIRDRDRDDRDDRTRAPVTVRSIASGLVVAVNPAWAPGSAVRGGIYVWIYEPVTDALFYYAHLRRAAVKPGDCVAPGDALGEVGRTGKNAYARRSPTHLHLSTFGLVDGVPTPRDPYADLRRAQRSRR